MPESVLKFDYVVIGSGLAGMIFALEAASKGSVAILTKKAASNSATNLAQGGIAAVWSDDDSFDVHMKDTLLAGAGLCRKDVVRLLVENGPQAIKKLINYGTHFTKTKDGDETHMSLRREGGHTKRRILHASDITGSELQRALTAATKAEKNITFFEEHTAIDLVLKSKMEGQPLTEEVVVGVFAHTGKETEVKTFLAPVTFLASGGAGKVYLYTSNPDVATGDGIAMAYRAGAKIANMEFMQFHPTCFYHPEAKSFLISEAVRGEGGVLRLMDGTEFMQNYHPMGCLAPRDVVAQAIDTEMKKRGDDHVFLDVTHLEGFRVREEFPNIYRTLKEYGYDMTRQMIPVVPAAHYICGGVNVDVWGRSSIKGLYAGGETACTGVHGANRLASNSLLEAVVFSLRAAEVAMKEWQQVNVKINNPWSSGNATDSDEQVVIAQNWDEVRRLMWSYVGILRSNKRLKRAERRMELLTQEIKEYYHDFLVTQDLVELRNIATCASLIIRSAQMRKESCGLHYNIDYPEKSLLPEDTFITKKKKKR